MLSSLPGCAVSSIKIDGVLHEFTSIDGIKEDVTEIVMNVKVGQKVIYSKYAGTEVKLGEEKFTVVRQNDILAVVED